MYPSGLAPPDHPSRKVIKKALPYPKTSEEKIKRRLIVARRTGRLDLASDAIKRITDREERSDGVSDVSTDGASQQLLDHIPQQQNVDGAFLTSVQLNDASEKTARMLCFNYFMFFFTFIIRW